ncbi:hypothetical protein AVEN_103092-1 [Araneus ventricosus]|uniref:Uncharacterized protein n=1 Tax=Araneus ventricosus TaxID=182803 RepID=A0A4Y2U3C8_ARAVE|nr:hypothetical protein AVEN_103092-1 [Araneus ventricosus]
MGDLCRWLSYRVQFHMDGQTDLLWIPIFDRNLQLCREDHITMEPFHFKRRLLQTLSKLFLLRFRFDEGSCIVWCGTLNSAKQSDVVVMHQIVRMMLEVVP